MTDNRKLLESAAKACGIFEFEDELCQSRDDGTAVVINPKWNPLHSSADCAAMCAKLMIGTLWVGGMDAAHALTDEYGVTTLSKDHNNDREAAWRYAATQVAAAIGEGK